MNRIVERLPGHLRVVLWLLLAYGALKLSREALLFAGVLAGVPSLSGLAMSVLLLFGVWEVRAGRRSGMHSLLFAHLLLPAVLVYGFVRGEIDRSDLEGWMIAVLAYSIGMSIYLLVMSRRIGWAGLSPKAHQPGSYQDWLTNPDFRASMAAWGTERDALVERDQETLPDVEELIRELIGGDDPELARHRLQALGERARPAALRALEWEVAVWGRISKRRRMFPPYYIVVELLGDPIPQPAAPWLARHLREGPPKVREVAARALASLAHDEFADAIVAALEDAEPEVRKGTAGGLHRAAREGRISAPLRDAVRASLAAALHDRQLAGSAAGALLAIDREAGLAAVFAADLWRADNPALGAILFGLPALLDVPPASFRSLVDDLVAAQDWSGLGRYVRVLPVDPLRLRALVGELTAALPVVDAPASPADADPGGGWMDAVVANWARRNVGSCLVTVLDRLVELRDAEAERLLRAAVALDRGDVSGDAARLLCVLHDVPTGFPFPDPEHLADASGPVRRYVALARFDSYACNGGLVHGVECLSEPEWGELEGAMDEIAPRSSAEILRGAFRLLAPGGLPARVADRVALIAKRFDAVEQALHATDEAWFADRHRVEIALWEYVTRHAADFRALSPPSGPCVSQGPVGE